MQPGQSAGKRATSAKGEAREHIHPAPNAKRRKTYSQRQMRSAGKQTSSAKCQARENVQAVSNAKRAKKALSAKCRVQENIQPEPNAKPARTRNTIDYQLIKHENQPNK